METRGRKRKEYPKEEIEEIVYRFTQEEKLTGWIKYSEVYRFSKKLYEKGEISYKLSEDFWRREDRQGRKAIDRANKAYETTITNNKTTVTDTFVDTEECVNKYFTGKPSDKKRLTQALKLNEKKAKDSNKHLSKIEDLKQEIANQKDKIKELEALIEQQENVLFSWFNASHKSDVPLINLITTGKSRHPIVDYFFETAFSSPEKGYEKFGELINNYREIEDKTKGSNKNVVTPIKKNRFQQITEQYD
ncbi:MAG: hypothetical protein LPK26_17160 [Bacillaceae bacterium]|nr:hypothetical protein [Bacillaceae bacterium]